MRRSARVYRRHRDDRSLDLDSGTIKSIERERGTGSIGPDSGSQVNADTGFTAADVTCDGFNTLQVGDRVRFKAILDPDRLGYADATTVETELATAAADQAVKNQSAALASGEENPG